MEYLVKAFLLILSEAIRYSFGLMSFAADLSVNAVYDLLKFVATKLAVSIMKHANKDIANQTKSCAAPVLPPELYTSNDYTTTIIVIIVMKKTQ